MSQWKRKGAKDTRAELAQTIRQELWPLVVEYGEKTVGDILSRRFAVNLPHSEEAVFAVRALERQFGENASVHFEELARAISANQRACTETAPLIG